MIHVAGDSPQMLCIFKSYGIPEILDGMLIVKFDGGPGRFFVHGGYDVDEVEVHHGWSDTSFLISGKGLVSKETSDKCRFYREEITRFPLRQLMCTHFCTGEFLAVFMFLEEKWLLFWLLVGLLLCMLLLLCWLLFPMYVSLCFSVLLHAMFYLLKGLIWYVCFNFSITLCALSGWKISILETGSHLDPVLGLISPVR